LDFLGLRNTYAEKDMVELLDMEHSGIKVSSYWTEALPKADLERKLHEAVTLARARVASMKEGQRR